MATKPARVIAIAAVWLLACAGARAQDAPKPDSSPVRVFINCTNTPCDDDFFRTEMTFVDHVRDRQTADVHILLTGQSTGSGGREITFDFFGQGRFMGRDLRLTERFLVAASNDDVRRGMVRVMSLGLVQNVLQTDAAQRRSKNHISMFADISLNLARGFSINFDGNLEYIRDQISVGSRRRRTRRCRQPTSAGNELPVLLFLRCVSYTFGSIFSPIVNPRFSGGS